MLTLYFYSTHGSISFKLSAKALYLTLGIGILISLGNFLIIKAFTIGAPQSQFSAIMYPTLIVYGFLIGILAFHEKIHFPQIIGIVFAGVGLFLIAYFRK